MSEQMEKNILKILKNQEIQARILDSHEKNIQKILKNQEEQQEFNKSVLNMLKNQKKNQEEFRKDLNEVKDNLNYVNKDLNEVKNNLNYVSKDLNEVKGNLDYVSKDLRSFSQHFAVFETVFGLKVDVLFEKYDTDYGEHKLFKKDIDSLKDDSFKHGVQIEHLLENTATV